MARRCCRDSRVRCRTCSPQSFSPTDIKTMTTTGRLGVMLGHVAPLLTLPRGTDTMGMAAPIYWTAEMVRQLPDDGNRYEVVYGELLVTPAPRFDHQLLVSRVSVAIATYLEREPVGLMLTSPADISWGLDVLVQPDVFVLPRRSSELPDCCRIRWLLLVVGVLRRSSGRSARFPNRPRYQHGRGALY